MSETSLIFILIVCALAGSIAFGIAWKVSHFFIPPQDHWKKSKYGIFSAKFGIASSAFGIIFFIVFYLFVEH